MQSRKSLASAIALASILACACSPGGSSDRAGPARPEPRLVVLYATCTLNRDYLGAYDSSVSFTPELDQFADESVVFRRHQSESGQSGISFASIFSGTQSPTHGVYTHPTRLPDDLYLITEAFADAGYEPFFWSGHPMAAYELNYAQGVAPGNVFDPQRPNKRAKKLSFLQSTDAQFQTVLKRLKADPDYRAFLLVDFSVTHGLYHKQQPEAFYQDFLNDHPQATIGLSMDDLRRAWALYAEHYHDLQWDFPGVVSRLGLTDAAVRALSDALEVTYRADVAGLDAMFGRMLNELRRVGVLDESLIAFTADHGETFCRDETLFKWTHGLQLAPEVLSVPWIVRSPMHAEFGLEPGAWEGVTRSIDVYPTMAGLCGIDVQGRGIQGKDLAPAMLGEEELEPLLAFSHTTTIGPLHIEDFRGYGLASEYWHSESPDLIWVRVREGDMVYKWRNMGGETFGAEAFDLARDPTEANNLFDASDPLHALRLEQLKGYRALLREHFGNRAADLPEDALSRLQDLGYVSNDDE